MIMDSSDIPVRAHQVSAIICFWNSSSELIFALVLFTAILTLVCAHRLFTSLTSLVSLKAYLRNVNFISTLKLEAEA